MKKFILDIIKFISIFLLLTILFIITIEGYISIFKNNIFSEKNLEKIYYSVIENYNWLDNINSDHKILLIGSSSVKYGLSCSELNKLSNNKISFINLSMNARGPIEAYFLLKNINLEHVTNIYLGLDPWIYTKKYYRYRNSYMYLDFNFLQSVLYFFEHDKSTFIKRYKALLTYIKPFTKQDINRKIFIQIPDDFGSEVLDKEPKNFGKPGKRVDLFQIKEYGWSKLQFEYFKKIAIFCKSKNISFSVFLPPKRSDYSQSYKKNYRTNNDEYINNILNKNIIMPIFGKYDQLDNLGDYDLFADSVHLNKHGQEVYSEIFYNMINKKNEMFNKNYSWYQNK